VRRCRLSLAAPYLLASLASRTAPSAQMLTAPYPLASLAAPLALASLAAPLALASLAASLALASLAAPLALASLAALSLPALAASP
jgi:hypothetical protein